MLQIPDLYVVEITREEIENKHVARVLDLLNAFLEPPLVREACEKVMVTVGGYDEDPREIWEFPEIRAFMVELDQKWPYWLYFLEKDSDDLLAITHCLCDSEELGSGITFLNSKKLGVFLAEHFGPMNACWERAGMSMPQNVALTNRVIDYYAKRSR